MKILTYGAVFWLVYVMAARSAFAARLLNALIIIGTAYALYALILGFLGIRQFELFYSAPPVGSPLAGPFVLHNSFATYVGLITLCGLTRLFCIGRRVVVTGAGMRNFVSSFTQFLFGSGVFAWPAVILCFSMLVASGSRAGFLAVLVGGITLLLFSLPLATRRETIGWAGIAVVSFTLFAIILFQINGATLQMRFDALVDAGGVDPVRIALWDVATYMIADEPVLGVGLGTFETAYPLYAGQFLPFSIDKAHNDYLELAAGWGLPAAAAWLLALAGLLGLCLRALFIRRRNRAYPLLALGATALVAFHSAFDFSLQIPAVALTYATILGMGVAQAFPASPKLPRVETPEREAPMHAAWSRF
jgi:O-antigen ligase